MSFDIAPNILYTFYSRKSATELYYIIRFGEQRRLHMISYVNTPLLQYQVSTTVMDLVVVFALFVFILALLFFCVATVFSVSKDLYKRR